MEWLVGGGTLALAVATVILAEQAYHTRVDATQPAVAVVLDPPFDAPLKPPVFESQRPAPGEAGEHFTDRDSESQLLLVRATGAVLNDGPRAATIEMASSAKSSAWEALEIVSWDDDQSLSSTSGPFRADAGSPLLKEPLVGDLTKASPRPLRPGRYLLPARSISRLQITLGATVRFWGTASASESLGPPPPLRSVSRVLEVRPAGGGGAVDRIRFELRAAPVRRNPDGDGWVVGSPVEVRSDAGTMYVMPHPESLVAPPVRTYPFGVRRVLRWLGSRVRSMARSSSP